MSEIVLIFFEIYVDEYFGLLFKPKWFLCHNTNLLIRKKNKGKLFQSMVLISVVLLVSVRSETLGVSYTLIWHQPYLRHGRF